MVDRFPAYGFSSNLPKKNVEMLQQFYLFAVI